MSATILLSGCASWFKTSKEIEVSKIPIAKTPLGIPLPEPISISPIEWIVLTPENANEVFARLKEKDVDPVIIGITDDGYETMAITFAELRVLIATQRAIIIKYQQYYESPAK